MCRFVGECASEGDLVGGLYKRTNNREGYGKEKKRCEARGRGRGRGRLELDVLGAVLLVLVVVRRGALGHAVAAELVGRRRLELARRDAVLEQDVEFTVGAAFRFRDTEVGPRAGTEAKVSGAGRRALGAKRAGSPHQAE